MQLITLTKEFREESFIKFMGEIFAHPEIISGSVKEIVITRETPVESGRSNEAKQWQLCN